MGILTTTRNLRFHLQMKITPVTHPPPPPPPPPIPPEGEQPAEKYQGRSKTPRRRFLKPADWIIICVLLVGGTGTWLAARFLVHRNTPKSVHVTTAGESFTLQLKDTSLILAGPVGDTRIKIQDGKVWVDKASCPNQLCVRQGKISAPHESIVCLPNRIVITLQGESNLDAVTQ